MRRGRPHYTETSQYCPWGLYDRLSLSKMYSIKWSSGAQSGTYWTGSCSPPSQLGPAQLDSVATGSHRGECHFSQFTKVQHDLAYSHLHVEGAFHVLDDPKKKMQPSCLFCRNMNISALDLQLCDLLREKPLKFPRAISSRSK